MRIPYKITFFVMDTLKNTVSFSYCGYKIPDHTPQNIPTLEVKLQQLLSVKKLNYTGRCPHIHFTSVDETIQNKCQDNIDVCVCVCARARECVCV